MLQILDQCSVLAKLDTSDQSMFQGAHCEEKNFNLLFDFLACTTVKLHFNHPQADTLFEYCNQLHIDLPTYQVLAQSLLACLLGYLHRGKMKFWATLCNFVQVHGPIQVTNLPKKNNFVQAHDSVQGYIHSRSYKQVCKRLQKILELTYSFVQGYECLQGYEDAQRTHTALCKATKFQETIYSSVQGHDSVQDLKFIKCN